MEIKVVWVDRLPAEEGEEEAEAEKRKWPQKVQRMVSTADSLARRETGKGALL